MDAENDAGLIRFLSRHIVSLGCRVNPKDRSKDGRRFFVSGFVVSIRDVWFLATAGHVIEAIEALMRDESNEYEFALFDSFGLDVRSRQPIPFDYASPPKWWSHDEEGGLDFGLIPLRPLYRLNLEANGIVPVEETNWREQHEVEFESYVMLGFPQELMGLDDPTFATVTSKMVWVSAIPEPPERLRRHSIPMLYARLEEVTDLRSIVGMSGCPIFGFARRGNGETRYWLTAVQSGWLPERRVIYACRFQPLAQTAEKHFGELIDDLRAEQVKGGEKASPSDSGHW